MSDVAQARTEAVASAMDDIRKIEADLGVTKDGVAAIRDRLVELAAHRNLFPAEDFPAPGVGAEAAAPDGRKSYMYRLAQDADDRFALYAQASYGEVKTPVHDHTTWAVVVGFDGQELNRFFERTEDGGVTKTHQHTVEAGTGVAMLPTDLHSIQIEGSALNFHCYGLALERLNERQYFDAKSHQWKSFSNIDGIREARSLANC